MTPKGHADTQSRQPLQVGSLMKTVSNSVRRMAPVGQTSRHGALTQCLHTSDIISQATRLGPSRSGFSMNLTSPPLNSEHMPVLSTHVPTRPGNTEDFTP